MTSVTTSPRPRISVVIPARNEARVLPHVFAGRTSRPSQPGPTYLEMLLI
jgi:hypothetical protein